jgi:hypothetical protein
MRWHKEEKCNSEDADIMSHPTNGETKQALDRFNTKFAGDPGMSVLIYRRVISNLTAPIVFRTLTGQFS